ncbi:MAG: AhpC/TSA family protein [Bacteroidales bacterium]|jgi:thiol-disulfide isomerase/thioredoxin|nr:AhpC/TSA family protein [Bacteroidales bacterium]
MKQLVLILCMVFAAPYAWGQGYVITGEVKGADGQTVSLKQFRDLQPVEVSATTVISGKFTLKGAAPYPEFCLLYVGDQGAAPFFVENSNIRIVVDMENMEKSKVSGSKENDIFMEFMGGMEKYALQQKQLNDSYAALSSSSVAAPDAVSNIRAQMEKLNADRIAYMVHDVQKHPGKISTAFIVNMYLMHVLDMSQMEQVAGGFDAKTDPSPWVKMLKDHVASLKRTDIGQPFPDITLKNPDDHPVSLSDYAGKGKYVLIDFWASWCGPCRNANPQVVELYQRYKNKGFEIVGVSLDRGKKEWMDAIKSDRLAWPHMSDLNYWQSAAAKLYSVSSIPYTVLLDKNGKIIAKGLHVGELRAKLAELLD